MAQAGFTPISLYYSSTTGAAPTAGNLVNGELALNTADGLLYYKNSGGVVVPLGGGLAWQTVKTANFTATANSAYPINTTGGAVTVTFPASPVAGQAVSVLDYAGTFATNKLTINPNGSNLNGASGNVTLNTSREAITFVYGGAAQGWVAYGSFNASVPPPAAVSISYLVVAGGGGASQVRSGGGGAGGLLAGTASLLPGSTYAVIVGAGGAGAVAGFPNSGVNGNNSTLSGSGLTTVTSIGGGYGNTADAGSGGSGGGSGGFATYVGGSGVAGQGNAGGSGGDYGAAGGGGAGAVGQGIQGTYSSGNGGIGAQSSITGSAVFYAAGGGGGGGTAPGGNVNPGVGGTGGGGNGGFVGDDATSAAANKGSGGGGAGTDGFSYFTGGSGGSGVVILSVPTSQYTGTTTGGPTVTTSGANTILKFTSSGSYTA